MKNVVRSLWVPFLLLVLFVVGTFYEQQIIMRLGVATITQLRGVFPYVLHSGIWLSLAYLVNRVIGVVLWDPLNRRVPVPRLLRDVTAVLVYALAITAIVGVVFDRPIGPFWAASGAAGIVIGLALRNVIVDIFIGLAVNFDRPFEIGHFIQLGNGPAGRVVELNWRTTRLATSDRNLVVVPNGKLAELIVTNFSRPGTESEFEFTVCLDADVAADRALRVLTAAARSVAGTADILEQPAPKARLRGFAANGVEYQVKYYLDARTADLGRAKHEVLKAVLDQMRHSGLELATPKQDLFHARRPQRKLDAHSVADRIELLDRVELFHGCTEEDRMLLATRMQERTFEEGAVIIRGGEAGESMFVLFEGLLNVMIAMKPDEPESRVARLQAGMFFGEMSALTGAPRSATIVAATDAVVFEITKADIAALLERRPETAEILSRAAAARSFKNTEARTIAGSRAQQAEETSLAIQIIGKLRAFFAIKPRVKGFTAGPFPPA